MKTKEQVLKENIVKVDKLQRDYPLLFTYILKAMDQYAEEYFDSKVNGDESENEKALHKQSVNNFYNEHTAKEELKELIHWYDDEFDKVIQEIRDEKLEQQYDEQMESNLKSL